MLIFVYHQMGKHTAMLISEVYAFAYCKHFPNDICNSPPAIAILP